MRRNKIKLRTFIALVLITIIVIVILNFFSVINAKAEQAVVNLEIANIKKLYSVQKFLDPHANLDPASWQIRPSFLGTSKLNYITNSYNILPGSWGFNINQKELIYHIKEPVYFKSSDGLPFIVLRLVNMNKIERIKVSNFKWCIIKSWQGCNQW